jgi:hypothetical protein
MEFLSAIVFAWCVFALTISLGILLVIVVAVRIFIAICKEIFR